MPVTYCAHDRLAEQCETCHLVRALEQGQQLMPAPPTLVTERVSVDVDTVIERADIGEGYTTLVIAGDLVPMGLEDLPRRPAGVRSQTSLAEAEATADGATADPAPPGGRRKRST